MITITEKDGATIIVIENPSGSEQRVIEQARKAIKALSDDVWSKFACNKGKTLAKNEQNSFDNPNDNSSEIDFKKAPKNKEQEDVSEELGEYIDLSEFEPLYDMGDCPF